MFYVKAYESNSGDYDIVYSLNNGANVFYGSDISLKYKTLAGIYNFNYSSSSGENWTANSVIQTIFIDDVEKPKNVYKRYGYQDGTIILTSLWQDKCSKVVKGIVTENSLGFYRNHTVESDSGQINYVFDKKDLRDLRGCRIFGGFLCLKVVNYKIKAIDSYDNENSVSGTFFYLFLLR